MRPPRHTATNCTLSSLRLVVIFISQINSARQLLMSDLLMSDGGKSVKDERLTSERSLSRQSAESKNFKESAAARQHFPKWRNVHLFSISCAA